MLLLVIFPYWWMPYCGVPLYCKIVMSYNNFIMIIRILWIIQIFLTSFFPSFGFQHQQQKRFLKKQLANTYSDIFWQIVLQHRTHLDCDSGVDCYFYTPFLEFLLSPDLLRESFLAAFSTLLRIICELKLINMKFAVGS